MATHPTRIQQRIADDLAEALVLIVGSAQREGSGGFHRSELDQILDLVGKIATGFTTEEIVSRALRRRIEKLGWPQTAFEILTLVESEIHPRAMLLMDDEALQNLINRLESELGEL